MSFLSPHSKFERIATKPAEDMIPLEEIHPTIRKKIFEKLGKPENFHHLSIVSVGKDRYRTNIVCLTYTKDTSFYSYSIPYSYYVTINGKEVSFNPPVQERK